VSAFEVGDGAQLRVVATDELAEDGQRAGELVDGLGAQHAGPHVEIGEQRPADLGRGDRAEPGVSGRWASLAAVLGGQLDHAGLEQQAAKAEQLAASAAARRCGQPRGRVDRVAERVEILDGERAGRPTREHDRERQHRSHGHRRGCSAQPVGGVAEALHVGWEQRDDPAGHAVPEVLGKQELGVGSTPSRHDGERDQLPGARAAA
jgi:hypothetical protein